MQELVRRLVWQYTFVWGEFCVHLADGALQWLRTTQQKKLLTANDAKRARLRSSEASSVCSSEARSEARSEAAAYTPTLAKCAVP